jgi:hypothetical protein
MRLVRLAAYEHRALSLPPNRRTNWKRNRTSVRRSFEARWMAQGHWGSGPHVSANSDAERSDILQTADEPAACDGDEKPRTVMQGGPGHSGPILTFALGVRQALMRMLESKDH